MSEETITFNLELNVEQCMSNIRQLEGVLYRTMGVIQRLGLPEDQKKMIAEIQHTIMIIRLLHTSLIMLESGTTWGLIKAALGIASAIFSFGDMIDHETRGR